MVPRPAVETRRGSESLSEWNPDHSTDYYRLLQNNGAEIVHKRNLAMHDKYRVELVCIVQYGVRYIPYSRSRSVAK